jgi:hypothetical protein
VQPVVTHTTRIGKPAPCAVAQGLWRGMRGTRHAGQRRKRAARSDQTQGDARVIEGTHESERAETTGRACARPRERQAETLLHRPNQGAAASATWLFRMRTDSRQAAPLAAATDVQLGADQERGVEPVGSSAAASCDDIAGRRADAARRRALGRDPHRATGWRLLRDVRHALPRVRQGAS